MSSPYDRQHHLPRLIGIRPDVLADTSADGTRAICGVLFTALKRERQRGRAGHFAYSLPRHKALMHAYEHELAALTMMTRQEAA